MSNLVGEYQRTEVWENYIVKYYENGYTVTPWISFPLFGIHGELIKPGVIGNPPQTDKP